MADRAQAEEETKKDTIDLELEPTDDKDMIKNYECLRNKFNSHRHRMYTKYSTGSPIL